MDINEHLAVNVMGFEKLIYPDTSPITGDAYFDKGNDLIMVDWNPTENIEQAHMCLDKFEDWRIRNNHPTAKGFYLVSIGLDVSVFDKFLPKAIALACAKATGWEGAA